MRSTTHLLADATNYGAELQAVAIEAITAHHLTRIIQGSGIDEVDQEREVILIPSSVTPEGVAVVLFLHIATTKDTSGEVPLGWITVDLYWSHHGMNAKSEILGFGRPASSAANDNTT